MDTLEWAKKIPESMWLPRYQQPQQVTQGGNNSTTTMEKDEENV